jgi:hypothetical protein
MQEKELMYNVSDAMLFRISGGATSHYTLAIIDADFRDSVAVTHYPGSNIFEYLVEFASKSSN